MNFIVCDTVWKSIISMSVHQTYLNNTVFKLTIIMSVQTFTRIMSNILKKKTGRYRKSKKSGWTRQNKKVGWTDKSKKVGWTDKSKKVGWTDKCKKVSWTYQSKKVGWTRQSTKTSRTKCRLVRQNQKNRSEKMQVGRNFSFFSTDYLWFYYITVFSEGFINKWAFYLLFFSTMSFNSYEVRQIS